MASALFTPTESQDGVQFVNVHAIERYTVTPRPDRGWPHICATMKSGWIVAIDDEGEVNRFLVAVAKLRA